MRELAYVEVNPNGYSYCSFPYSCTTNTSILFKKLYVPLQPNDGKGHNIFTEGPGRFQSTGNGFEGNAPNISGANGEFVFRKWGGGNPIYYSVDCGNIALDGDVEVGNAYVKVDGVTIATGTTYTGDTISLTAPFYLFNSFNSNWEWNYIYSGRCGQVIFYENGVETAKYTPYEDDNGVAGFYDEQNHTMIYSKKNAWVAGPDATSIRASASKSSLAASGETSIISITTENDWVISQTDNWLTLSATGGTGTTTITATAPSYSGTTERTTTLTITDMNTTDEAVLTIKQRKYTSGTPLYLGTNEVSEIYVGDAAVSEAYLGEYLVYSSGPFQGLKMSPKSFSFNSGSLSATCKVKSSESWTMVVPAWVSASTLTGGTGDTIVTLSTTAQSASTAGTITITSANYSVSASCEYHEFIPVNYIHSQNMGNNVDNYKLQTGIYPTLTTKAELKFQYKGYGTGNWIVGMYVNDNQDWRLFNYNKPNWCLDISSGRLNQSVGAMTSDRDYDFEFGNFYITNKTDDISVSSTTQTGTISENQIEINLSIVWINELKLWQGETLVFDGQAAKMGNQYGLFDTVGGTFITTNDFTIVGEE